MGINFILTEMDEKEQLECAKSYRGMLFAEKNIALGRCAELADEFTRLEVQIAAILVAFAGSFLKFFEVGANLLSHPVLLIVKFIYILSIFLLILSLTMGLIHIKRKEKFWDDDMNAKFITMKKWNDCTKKKVSFDEAISYQTGTSLEKGNIIHSPLWTWVLQTVCLGIALGLFFVLFVVFIFVK